MNLDEPPRFPRQRIRTLAHALLAGAMLVVILTPVGEAQRGPGRGRQRPPEPAPPEPSAAGEYALDGPQAIAAVNRGEGQQALAYYERTAREAEQQRDQVRAARAWHAATMVSIRLGRYQKAIRSGSRTIDLFKSASGLTQPDIVAWASTYSHLGGAYRIVGDLPKARETLEQGLEVTRTRLSGRREGHAEGFLLNGLALVAYAQRDYPTALARSTEAGRFFEAAESRLPPRAPERMRTNLRRWAAGSFYGVGRAQLALGHPNKAEVAFDRGLDYARRSGLREMEVELLTGQGALALARQDWPKALATLCRTG